MYIYWSPSTLCRRDKKNTHSFISAVRPSIHTNLSENAALFLPLGRLYTLTRQTTEFFENAHQSGGI